MAKPAKDSIRKGPEIMPLKVLHLIFNLRSRTVDSDLRWKQGAAEKISGCTLI